MNKKQSIANFINHKCKIIKDKTSYFLYKVDFRLFKSLVIEIVKNIKELNF